MTSKPAFVVVALTLLKMTLLASGEGGIKQPPEKTTTERVDFAPGGMIRINDSYGDLNIEGWDRPEVEVTVIKTLPYGHRAKEPDQGASDLDRVWIVTEHKSPPELTISTALPSRRLPWTPPFTRHTTGGVMVQYEIHVPRDRREGGAGRHFAVAPARFLFARRPDQIRYRFFGSGGRRS